MKTPRTGTRLALALALVAACGTDDGTGLPPRDPVSVEVTPGAAAIPAGGSVQLSSVVRDSGGQPVSGQAVIWTSTNAGIADVDDGGLVTGMSAGDARIVAAAGTLRDTADITVFQTGTGPVITVIPQTSYQRMTGWEAVTQIGQTECNPVALENYRFELYDRAVNELGLNRLRLEIVSGTENPTDYYTQYKNGQITINEFRQTRYQIVNDNNDPNVINPAGFQFSSLDAAIDLIVVPIRQQLMARGEQLYVNLNYVDFGPTAFEHAGNPQEYAELMLATFQHLDAKYGFVPDAVEIILEPDNSPGVWADATRIGQALVATAQRLEPAGFQPDFVAPSTTNAQTGIAYFNTMRNVPGVMNYLDEVSYHRYSGTGAVPQYGDIAEQYGVRTAMLEHAAFGEPLKGDYLELHQDLKDGHVSAWQQFALAFCDPDNGNHYFWIDQSNPGNPVVHTGSRTRFLTQYFRDVRLDAVRIEATSSSGSLDPVAFRNTDDRYVVVVKTTGAGAFEVAGLPAGTYGIRYTTGAEYARQLTDVTVVAGQPVPAAIPAAGVITIHAR